VKTCTYPLTAVACVSRVYSDLAVLDVTAHGFKVMDCVAGLSHLELEKITQLTLIKE
jgi:3-oxoadipate CoA-transferase beta subunit